MARWRSRSSLPLAAGAMYLSNQPPWLNLPDSHVIIAPIAAIIHTKVHSSRHSARETGVKLYKLISCFCSRKIGDSFHKNRGTDQEILIDKAVHLDDLETFTGRLTTGFQPDGRPSHRGSKSGARN